MLISALEREGLLDIYMCVRRGWVYGKRSCRLEATMIPLCTICIRGQGQPRLNLTNMTAFTFFSLGHLNDAVISTNL